MKIDSLTALHCNFINSKIQHQCLKCIFLNPKTIHTYEEFPLWELEVVWWPPKLVPRPQVCLISRQREPVGKKRHSLTHHNFRQTGRGHQKIHWRPLGCSFHSHQTTRFSLTIKKLQVLSRGKCPCGLSFLCIYNQDCDCKIILKSN